MQVSSFGKHFWKSGKVLGIKRLSPVLGIDSAPFPIMLINPLCAWLHYSKNSFGGKPDRHGSNIRN
jgi:hypothetical protein